MPFWNGWFSLVMSCVISSNSWCPSSFLLNPDVPRVRSCGCGRIHESVFCVSAQSTKPVQSVRLQVVQSSVHLFSAERRRYLAELLVHKGRIKFKIVACSFIDWEKLFFVLNFDEVVAENLVRFWFRDVNDINEKHPVFFFFWSILLFVIRYDLEETSAISSADRLCNSTPKINSILWRH